MEIWCFVRNGLFFVDLQTYAFCCFFHFSDLGSGNPVLNRRFCDFLHFVAKVQNSVFSLRRPPKSGNWQVFSKTSKNREKVGSDRKIRFTGTFPLAGRGFFGHFWRFFAIFSIFSIFRVYRGDIQFFQKFHPDSSVS